MANNESDKLYQSLHDGGQSYFGDLMGYSGTSPRRLQRLLLMRDKARNNNTLDTLPKHLNEKDKQLNMSIADSERHANTDDLQKVNHYMERNDVVKSLENKGLADNFFKEYIVARPVRNPSETTRAKRRQRAKSFQKYIHNGDENVNDFSSRNSGTPYVFGSSAPRTSGSSENSQSASNATSSSVAEASSRRLDSFRAWFDQNHVTSSTSTNSANTSKSSIPSGAHVMSSQEMQAMGIDPNNEPDPNQQDPNQQDNPSPSNIPKGAKRMGSAESKSLADEFGLDVDQSQNGPASNQGSSSIPSGAHVMSSQEMLAVGLDPGNAPQDQNQPDNQNGSGSNVKNQSHAVNHDSKATQQPSKASSNPQPTETDEALSPVDKATKRGTAMYKGLSPQGRHYFDMNLAWARKLGNDLDDVKKADGDAYRNFKDISYREANTLIRASANGEIVKNYKRVHQNKPLTAYDRKPIDEFFASKAGIASAQGKQLGQNIKNIKTDEQMSNFRKMRLSQTPEIQDKNLDKGMKLYRSLTPAGQKLFGYNAKIARDHPGDFHKFKTDYVPKMEHYNSTLENIQNGTRRHRNGEYGVDPNLKVSQDERAKVNRYFKNIGVFGISDKLIHHVNDYNTKQYVDGNPENSPVKPHVDTDYFHKDRGRYVESVRQGVHLYDNLSQRGRKYLLTASQYATKNIDDFNKAMKNNPNTLNDTQKGIREHLSKLSGWGDDSQGRSMVLTPDHAKVVPRSEKKRIHDFLNDKVTQEGLTRGDTYNAILIKNIKNRQLLETVQDEHNMSNSMYKPFERMAERDRRRHPLSYMAGAGMANVIDGIHYKGGDMIKRNKYVQKALGNLPTPKKGLRKAVTRHRIHKNKPLNDFIQRSNKRLMERTKSHHKSHSKSKTRSNDRGPNMN